MSNSPETTVWTVRALRDWTATFLTKKGFEYPRLEAELLLAFSMGISRVELFIRFDDVPTDEVRARYRELVRRRGLGEPVAYLIGNKEFYSLDFSVGPGTLVPRPETEQLVLEAVEYAKKRSNLFRANRNKSEIEAEKAETSESGESAEASEKPEAPVSAVAGPESGASRADWRICDMGCGSGCIAVALAKNVPNSRIVAADASPEALKYALKNAVRHGVDDRIKLVKSDLFAEFPSGLPESSLFDMIVSNPPYVSESEYETLEPTVKNFEPRIALVGGPTGAELPIRMMSEAPLWLKRGGRIFVELSPTTVRAVASAAEADSRWSEVKIARDFANLERFVFAVRA